MMLETRIGATVYIHDIKNVRMSIAKIGPADVANHTL